MNAPYPRRLGRVIWKTQTRVLSVREGLPHQIPHVGVREVVQHARPLTISSNHTGVAQDGQVTAHGALGQLQPVDQLVNVLRPDGQQEDKTGPGRVGKRFEEFANLFHVCGWWLRRGGVRSHRHILASGYTRGRDRI